MTIFGPKPWVNPFGKMSIFQLFELHLFIAQKGVFALQNIVKDIFLLYIAEKKKLEKLPFFDQNHGLNPLENRKRHFPGLYYPKKKLEKWPFLDQNHGITPLQKCTFLKFLNFLFLQPRKAFFRSRISRKTFSQLIFPKKKVEKMAIFGPKQWVNPFGKMSTFPLFEFLVLIAQKGVFSLKNIVNDIFLAYIS